MDKTEVHRSTEGRQRQVQRKRETDRTEDTVSTNRTFNMFAVLNQVVIYLEVSSERFNRYKGDLNGYRCGQSVKNVSGVARQLSPYVISVSTLQSLNLSLEWTIYLAD